MGTNRIFTFTFILMLASLGLGISGVLAESGGPAENPVRFVILGDRTGDAEPGVYEQIIVEAERLKPEFVITVGDMIDGYTQDTLQLISEWDSLLQMFEAFSVPVYFTAGNHDITYDIAESSYRRFAGEPNYSFDHRGLHFTVFDNSRWESSGELPEGYLRWLENDLKQNQGAAYIFVFMHKPFWYRTTLQSFPDTLHTLFRTYGVDAVVTGHFHQYFAADLDGIAYTSLGSSGGSTGTDLIGPKYHFAWVTVDDKGINLAPIAYESVLPRDVVTGEETLLMYKSKYLGLEFTNPALVDENLAVAESTVGVMIQNYNRSVAVDDTIRWEIPEGWTVEPAIMPVRLAAGESGRFEFTIAGNNGLKSTPKISLNLPIGEERTRAVSRDLHVARLASCPKAAEPPKLDGKLDEACWQAAVSGLLAPGGEPSALDPTRFYFAFDRDNLYLAARCEDSQIDSVTAEVAEQDGPVYSEDCVGYFVQPNLYEKIVYQIYFNPRGTAYDVQYKAGTDGYLSGDRSWDGVYEVGTARTAEAWTIEVRIPLAQLGVSAESGQDWGLNFRRKQPRLGSAADWQQPIDTDPQTLGVLRLR